MLLEVKNKAINLLWLITLEISPELLATAAMPLKTRVVFSWLGAAPASESPEPLAEFPVRTMSLLAWYMVSKGVVAFLVFYEAFRHNSIFLSIGHGAYLDFLSFSKLLILQGIDAITTGFRYPGRV